MLLPRAPISVTLVDSFYAEATLLRQCGYVSLDGIVNALAVVSFFELWH